MWERAMPAKGSEAPGRMPETPLTACGSLPCKRKAGKAGRQDSRDLVGAVVRKVSGILPGAALPFAGKARSHKPSRQKKRAREGPCGVDARSAGADRKQVLYNVLLTRNKD